MNGRAVELGYAAGWKLVRLLPPGAARILFNAGADHVTRRAGRGVWQLTRNLRRVVGDQVSEAELAELVADGMRSYARYWMEAFRLPNQSAEQIRESFQMHNPRLFDQARTGCILALPHAANWEHAGVWATGQGIGLVSVAERLEPEGLYRRFLSYREKLGIEVLPTRGGDRPAMQVLTERAEAGYIVALLADRDLSARGVPVTFFGHPTRMPVGPAALALQTGRPLFAVNLWYTDGGTHAELVGPLRPTIDGSLAQRTAELTQQVADAMAAGIAAHPTDWHMLARLWLDDRPRSVPGSPVDPATAPAAAAG